MNLVDPVRLAQALIRCPSVTPEDAGAMEAVERALAPLGFSCRRLPFASQGRPKIENLYASLGAGGPNLCFAGHTDVVPAGDISSWSVDPFAAEIRGGALIGRGAVDMKAAIACWIAAVSEVLAERVHIPGTLSMLITGDEEAESINGTVKVLGWLKQEGIKLDSCIVGEPTNPSTLGEMIKIGRRGSATFTLTVDGIQGHVAYPDSALNPVTKLVAILHRLTAATLDKGTEFFPPSNLEITTVDVGNAASNVIPARARAVFNIRFNNRHTCESLSGWARTHCEAVTDRYTLTPGAGNCESFLTRPGSLSDLVSAAVKSVTGITPELGTTGGTSDARFIKDHCPVAEFGLINATAHKVDEQARLDDILALTRVYKEVITRYFNS